MVWHHNDIETLSIPFNNQKKKTLVSAKHCSVLYPSDGIRSGENPKPRHAVTTSGRSCCTSALKAMRRGGSEAVTKRHSPFLGHHPPSTELQLKSLNNIPMWGFPKIGLPVHPSISNDGIVHEKNHPAIGFSHLWKFPCICIISQVQEREVLCSTGLFMFVLPWLTWASIVLLYFSMMNLSSRETSRI